MKKIILTPIMLIAFYLGIQAQTSHTISISGLSFSPSNLSISVGDTVFFNGNSTHPVLEVSATTWNANENNALQGGFSLPSGLGKIQFDTEGSYYYICENHYSTGMKGKINVSTATNIIQAQGSKDIKMYPNPLLGDILSISYSGSTNSALECIVYDLTGKVKLAKTQELTSALDFTIDCSSLRSGMYIVQIKADHLISSSKLVKK